MQQQEAARAPAAVTVRAARDTDAKPVVELLSSNHHLEVAFDPAQFVVAERAGTIVACARLKPLADKTFELASVIVSQDLRQQGVGATIVRAALARARGRVYALALEPAFFQRQGFHALSEVPKLLTEKAFSVCAKSGFVPMERVTA